MNEKDSPARLWAPWRMEYIRSKKEEEGCIFCSRVERDNDREDLIIYRGEHNFVIMNRYPYNNGHLMVVPYRHEAEMDRLSREECDEMIILLQKASRALKQLMMPHGFNIGMNVGAAAGAGIDDHLHFHIVPRWNADTNFMPVVGHTRVVPETLYDTWAALHQIFKSI